MCVILASRASRLSSATTTTESSLAVTMPSSTTRPTSAPGTKTTRRRTRTARTRSASTRSLVSRAAPTTTSMEREFAADATDLPTRMPFVSTTRRASAPQATLPAPRGPTLRTLFVLRPASCTNAQLPMRPSLPQASCLTSTPPTRFRAGSATACIWRGASSMTGSP